MRIRHKPYARPELEAWPHFSVEPASLRGQWGSFYTLSSSTPLRLEVGCGKGGFISQISTRDRDCRFLGVDIKNEMLVLAKRKIEAAFAELDAPIDNAALTSYNVENIDQILSLDDNVDRLYINFCNPWYKSGHAKHRLTHPRQLVRYRNFLQPGASIYFKTDDDILFDDSLRYFELCGFDVTWLSRDLHKEDIDWNLLTEHERMFSEEGILIKACIAQMKPATLDIDAISKWKDV